MIRVVNVPSFMVMVVQPPHLHVILDGEVYSFLGADNISMVNLQPTTCVVCKEPCDHVQITNDWLDAMGNAGVLDAQA